MRLLRIDPHYRQQDPAKDEQQAGSLAELQLDPISLLREQYRQQYGESLPTELEALLLELVRADRGEAA